MMESALYHHPYSGSTFWTFFITLIARLWELMSGRLALENLATDEIQLIVLFGVAASSALVGCFLVLRKMTMLANSISHTILLGIVMAFLWTHDGLLADAHGHGGTINIPIMLCAATAMGIVTAFLTEALTKGARLQEDASTGIVFTSLFALGIITVTLLTRNAHIGTEVVMGNVDALQFEDSKLVYAVLVINIILFSAFFKEFKITTFDPGLARALGIVPIFFSYLLMTQASLTAVAAFRAVGVLMVLAFITGPALTARLLCDNLGKMLSIAVAAGILASLIGVALSRHVLTVYSMSLSTAGLVVCVILFLFLCAALYIKGYQKFKTSLR